MGFFKIIKIILRNFAAFALGAAAGVFLTIKFILPKALAKALENKGPMESVAGAIAITPVLLIIYGAISVVIGGILGIVVYNILKRVLRKK